MPCYLLQMNCNKKINYDYFLLKIKDNRRKQEVWLNNIIVEIMWITMDIFKMFIENSLSKKVVFKSSCLLCGN